MENQHLKSLIGQLEQEKRAHDEKFGGSSVHNDCLPRFETAINKLKEELAAHGGQTDQSEVVRGDELKPAEELNHEAEKLEERAKTIKGKAAKMVAKELNEMDGFPR